MSKRLRKRFIAGATCPKCQAQDTIMLFFENNVEKLTCVECGYEEAQPQEEVKTASRANENIIGVFKPE